MEPDRKKICAEVKEDEEGTSDAIAVGGFQEEEQEEAFSRRPHHLQAQQEHQQSTAELVVPTAKIISKEYWLRKLEQNGIMLSLAPLEIQDDTVCVLVAVKQDATALGFASERLRCDCDFLLQQVIPLNPSAVRFASQLVFSVNTDLFMHALRLGGEYLQHGPPNLRDDDLVVLEAVRNHGVALEYASERLQNTEDIVKEAVQQDGMALQFASLQFRGNTDIVTTAVRQNGWALQFGTFDMRDNPQIVTDAVQQNGYALQFAAPSLKDNRDICINAVTQEPWALRFASVNRRDDPVVVKEAVARNGILLKRTTNGMRRNWDIVEQAVRQDGMALKYAAAELRADRALVLASLENSYLALQWASDDLKNDIEVVAAAIHRACVQDEHANAERISSLANLSRILKASSGRVKTNLARMVRLVDEQMEIVYQVHGNNPNRPFMNGHDAQTFAEMWNRRSLETIWVLGLILPNTGKASTGPLQNILQYADLPNEFRHARNLAELAPIFRAFGNFLGGAVFYDFVLGGREP